MWENGVPAADTVDLSVSSSEIRPINAVKGKYVSGSSVDLSIGIQNKRVSTAEDVPFQVWEGPPGTGTLRATGTVAEVPGFNGVGRETVTVSGLQEGVIDLFVVVDTTAYPEPTYKNNIASRRVYVYPYQPGFPIALNDRVTQSVSVADIRENKPGREILLHTSRTMRCYSAFGESIWSLTSTQNAGSSDLVNGTPVVANVYKDGRPRTVFVDGPIYIVDGYGVRVDTLTLGSDIFFSTERSAGTEHAQTVALTDLIRNDDALEVITVSGKTDTPIFGKYVGAYSLLNDSLLWEKTIGATASRSYPATIAVGDIGLDGELDGNPEVLVRLSGSSIADSLYCFRSSGAIAWRVPGGLLNDTAHHTVLVPTTGAAAGHMDVLTTATTGVQGRTMEILRVSADATREQLVAETASESSGRPVLTAGDFLNDGHIGMLMGWESTLVRYDDVGNTVASLVSPDGRMLTDPLIVDVNGDDVLETIVVTGGAFAFSRNESRQVIEVLDPYMASVARFEFPCRNEDIHPRYAFASPAVGDIDDDGIAELAFVSVDSVLHVIELGTMGRSVWPQRYGNPMQANNLEQPVVGTYDEPVSLFNRVKFIGDATFNEPVYLDGTAEVSVSEDDVTQGGEDASRTEMWVNDEFRAIGSASHPIRIASGDGTSTVTDDWWGMFLTDTAPASSVIDHVLFRNAAWGLETRAPLTIKHSTIEDCKHIGISLAGDSTHIDSVYADHVTIRRLDGVGALGVNALGLKAAIRLDSCTVDDCPVGIETYSKAKLYTSHTTVSNASVYGVKVHGRAYANLNQTTVESASLAALKVHDASIVEATSSTFKTSDYGVDIGTHGGSPPGVSLTDCTITGNDVGVRIADAAGVSLTTCQVNANISEGIYCFEGEDVTVSGSTVHDNLYGLHSAGPGPELTDNTLDENDVAVYCDTGSSLFLRRNKVWNNAVGLAFVDDGTADLDDCNGTCPTTCPNANSIKSNSPWQVFNDTPTTIDAECNYWGGTPAKSKFYGPIDYFPYLTTDPLAGAALLAELPAPLPKVYSLSPNFPNPFNPTTTVVYEVPPPGGRIRIRIFNVTGQLVRTLVNTQRSAGRYEATWDGSDRAAA